MTTFSMKDESERVSSFAAASAAALTFAGSLNDTGKLLGSAEGGRPILSIKCS